MQLSTFILIFKMFSLGLKAQFEIKFTVYNLLFIIIILRIMILVKLENEFFVLPHMGKVQLME